MWLHVLKSEERCWFGFLRPFLHKVLLGHLHNDKTQISVHFVEQDNVHSSARILELPFRVVLALH